MSEEVHVQFNESPTDERAETAYEIAVIQYVKSEVEDRDLRA